MKKTFALLTVVALMYGAAKGQEEYKALNLGLGIGYYGYLGAGPMPVFHANYEFDVVKNFTLAPFISFYTYRNDYYWGNPNNPPRYYTYRETVVPLGVKGSYYFDQLFEASSKWDFYGGASLGFTVRSVRWNNDYEGDHDVYPGASPLYIDAHVGSEYHMNDNVGFFLDLSTGVSTIGIAIL